MKYVGYGIARVAGLPHIRAEEIVLFPKNLQGLAFNIDPEEIGVILLGSGEHLHTGAEVRRTGRVLDTPVGDDLIGRMVDAIGRPLDHPGEIRAAQRLPVEQEAPGVMARDPVTVPLQTGIKVIDALIPIGRGQRELIVGDRLTGKTAIALDAIINQCGQERDLHLLRDRQEGLRRGQGRRGPQRAWGDGVYDSGGRHRFGSPRAAVYRALCRHDHGGVFHVQGPGRPDRLRRPDQSRPRPTGSCRCCCAARRDARPFRGTSSTSIRGCWKGPPISKRNTAAAP